MALPRLDTPQYDLTLYNGDNIKYRPFLVKEQKILLLAMEEKESKHIVNAMKQIVKNCTYDQVDVDKLPIFELENIFLRLREKSVGESINFRIRCTDDECEGLTEVNVDLATIQYDKTNVPETQLKISENVTLNMKFPTMKQLEGVTNLENMEDNFSFLAGCIESIEADGNIHTLDTTPKEEIKAFIESMTSTQFSMLREFFEKLPKLSTTLEYTCGTCGKSNERTISGLQNFLV
jgi:hypothetical protein